MPSLASSVPKPLKVSSLARSVPKPPKVPSLAHSVPKPLLIELREAGGHQPGRYKPLLIVGRRFESFSWILCITQNVALQLVVTR